MNKKKLLTLLSFLLFVMGISTAEKSFASEYSAEYSERMTGVEGANIGQDADPDLETIRTDTDDRQGATVFDEDEEDDDDDGILDDEDEEDIEEDDEYVGID